MFLKSLLKEPLVQFFFSGMVLYFMYINIDNNQETQNTQQSKKEIVIPQIQIDEYNQSLPLGMKNIEKLLTYHQILLEESYFLELYKQDKKIEEILVEKMALMLSQGEYKEPTEDELFNFYKKYKKEYGSIKKFSFYLLDVSQYSFNQAKKLTHKLNLLTVVPENLPLKEHMTLAQVKEIYGIYFAHQLQYQFSHKWSVPLLAKGKTYLVYITNKEIVQNESFENVENRVYQDYLYQQNLHVQQKALSQILQHYKIEVR